MSEEEKVDELVDKVIDEALAKSGFDEEEIKKRKPKPFRYITDKEEIQTELKSEKVNPVTMMKEPNNAEIVEDKLAILGFGDIETIENVIKKHEASRKIIEK